MEQNPIVGVILPVYQKDNADYFILSIESILNQSYKNIVVYIGVDGPVESPLTNVLNKYTGKFNINILYFPKNRGLAAVLNDLIHICRINGIQYIARMDADDISTVDRIESQLAYLSEHPQVDVVGGYIEEIDENSNKKGKIIHYPTTHKECKLFFRYRDPMAHPSVLFNISYFNKVSNCYREDYRKNQDTMLWFDGFQANCIFANIDKTILLFRVTEDFYLRRNGWQRAKKMLKDRFVINRELHYGISAYLFALAMFVITISPSFIKKFFYNIR